MRLAAVEGTATDLPAPLVGKLFEAVGGIAYWQADPTAAAAASRSGCAPWQPASRACSTPCAVQATC